MAIYNTVNNPNTFELNDWQFGISQMVILGAFSLGSSISKNTISKYSISQIIINALKVGLIGSTTCAISEYTLPGTFWSLAVGVSIFSFTSGLISPILSRYIIKSAETIPTSIKMSLQSFTFTISATIISALLSVQFIWEMGIGFALIFISILSIIVFSIIKQKPNTMEQNEISS